MHHAHSELHDAYVHEVALKEQQVKHTELVEAPVVELKEAPTHKHAHKSTPTPRIEVHHAHVDSNADRVMIGVEVDVVDPVPVKMKPTENLHEEYLCPFGGVEFDTTTDGLARVAAADSDDVKEKEEEEDAWKVSGPVVGRCKLDSCSLKATCFEPL